MGVLLLSNQRFLQDLLILSLCLFFFLTARIKIKRLRYIIKAIANGSPLISVCSSNWLLFFAESFVCGGPQLVGGAGAVSTLCLARGWGCWLGLFVGISQPGPELLALGLEGVSGLITIH